MAALDGDSVQVGARAVESLAVRFPHGHPSMPNEPNNLRHGQGAYSSAERLDSWKEIAAYLRHSVRTVRRWENEGLPVHRHAHKKKSAIYAYKPEVDLWWRDGRALERPQVTGRQRWLPGGRIMLAVLPFENLSGDANQEYFSDGLTEEMI